MMRTRAKICGITRIDDAVASVRAGADAIGLVFDPRSPRYVKPEIAADIVSSLPPFVTAVVLFVDADPAVVRETLRRVKPHLIQFHGSETPEQCRSYEFPYVKAIRMEEGVDLAAQARAYADAGALLLDTHVPSLAGGSGKTFDWTRVPRDLAKSIILAGGLTPDNVAEAVRTVRPYAVDVSSGVEKAKGIKDHDKVNAFLRALKETM
jgi:phosphoribosylanthranilate isomerase